jgi:hypothetical protein
MEGLIGLFFVAFAIAAVVIGVRAQARTNKWFARDLPELENSPCLGKIRDWEILGCKGRVVLASPYRNYSEGFMRTTDDRWFVALAPAQARELAGLMRLAAAPGKTLADAEEAFATARK